MAKYWSLFNKEEKLRVDDLSIEQVRTILLSIPSSKIREWYAWREGDVNWQSLDEVPEFFDDARAAKGVAHVSSPASGAEKRRPLFEDSPPDVSTEITLGIETVPTKERRSARRFTRRLIFRMSVGENDFECETDNISMAGISLAQTLPPGLSKTFSAELRLQGERLGVLCSQVSDHQVKILEAEAWDKLRQWIANW